jgi:hypothetical protein
MSALGVVEYIFSPNVFDFSRVFSLYLLLKIVLTLVKVSSCYRKISMYLVLMFSNCFNVPKPLEPRPDSLLLVVIELNFFTRILYFRIRSLYSFLIEINSDS